MSKQTPVAVYYRRSTRKQEDSIEAQKAVVTRHAKEKGYKIVAEYQDDGISGAKTEARSGFQAMLTDAAKGAFRLVLVRDMDRFSRAEADETMSVFFQLRLARVRLVTPRDGELDLTDEGTFLRATVEVMANNKYVKKLSRVVIEGMVRRLTEYRGWPGGSRPFGYQLERTDAGRKTISKLVPHPQEAPLLQEIFRMYADGASVRTLVEYLEERIPSRRSGTKKVHWSFGTVRRILANEVYLGKTVYNRRRTGICHRISNQGGTAQPVPLDKPQGKPEWNDKADWFTVEDTHEALVDEPTFAKVQAMIQERGRPQKGWKNQASSAYRASCTPHKNGGPYLLSGKIRCMNCGYMMIGFVSHYREGEPVYYYRCTGAYDHGTSVCRRRKIPQEALLNFIGGDLIHELTTVPEKREEWKARIRADLEARVEAVPVDTKRARQEIKTLARKIETGQENILLAPKSQVAELSAKLEQWKDQKRGLEEVLAEAERSARLKDGIEEQVERALRRLEEMTMFLTGPDGFDRDTIQTFVDRIELWFKEVPWVGHDGQPVMRNGEQRIRNVFVKGKVYYRGWLPGVDLLPNNLYVDSVQLATRTDIAFYHGEDVTLTVTMSPATNISGWSLSFTVKRALADTSALISKTTASGITIADAANGVFRIAIASANTNNANVGPGAYTYDVQRTDSGFRTVLAIGTLTVLPQVTL